jgi:(1->4)-alpha-D-glucan 1-alpha-D-glucosylmutase
MADFMQKAVKEAKIHTSWINPNEAYDRAVADFVHKTLAGPYSRRFLAEFLPAQQALARRGSVNSMAQLVLKFVTPGVPDFYQGTELWDWSLVDPDNRRPVDFTARRKLCNAMMPLFTDVGASAEERAALLAELLENWHDGRVKLFLTVTGLRLRRMLPDLFLHGEYAPLEAAGDFADQVVAIGRRFEDKLFIAVVPRLVGRLGLNDAMPMGQEAWRSTRLKIPGVWRTTPYRNLITLESLQPDNQEGVFGLQLADILNKFPVAFLDSN